MIELVGIFSLGIDTVHYSYLIHLIHTLLPFALNLTIVEEHDPFGPVNRQTDRQTDNEIDYVQVREKTMAGRLVRVKGLLFAAKNNGLPFVRLQKPHRQELLCQ